MKQDSRIRPSRLNANEWRALLDFLYYSIQFSACMQTPARKMELLDCIAICQDSIRPANKIALAYKWFCWSSKCNLSRRSHSADLSGIRRRIVHLVVNLSIKALKIHLNWCIIAKVCENTYDSCLFELPFKSCMVDDRNLFESPLLCIKHNWRLELVAILFSRVYLP